MITAKQIISQIYEAVISTEISDDDDMMRILDDFWDKYHHRLRYPEDIASLLTNELEGYDVTFKPSKNSSYNTILDHLAIAHDDYGYSFIAYYGEDFHLILSDKEIWKAFKKRFRKLLEHELVHYHQYILNKNPNKNQIQQSPVNVRDDKVLKDYLLHPYEIMAYARSIVRDFADNGYSKQDMLDMIKHNKYPKKIEDISIALDKYIKLFPKDDPVLKRLYSYLYQYAQKLD
jgi:hypothetical protein